MSWREKLRDLPIDVLVQLLVVAITAFLVKAYPISKKCLSNTAHAFRLACLKISSSFKKISFPKVSKLNVDSLMGGIGEILFSAPVRLVVGYFIFMSVLSYFGANGKTGHNTHAFVTPQSRTCVCPTFTDHVYVGATIEPGWEQPSVLPRNCTQRYGVRSHYPAQSVLYKTERTRVFDCSPARKGRRSKRMIQRCTIETPPVVLGIGGSSGSEFGIISDLQ
jgi:hypothetical protein